MAADAEAPLPSKDVSSEEDPLLPTDSKEKSRVCFGSCWNEGCCTEAFFDSRDAFWDNWRGIAQMGVLFLHLNVQPLLTPSKVFYDSASGRFYLGLGGFVFLVTMPTFCFISGYCSTAHPRERQMIHQVRYSFAWFIMHLLTFPGACFAHQQAVENSWKAEHPLLNETNVQLQSEGKPTLAPPGHITLPFFQTVGVDWYLWCVIIWRCALPALSMISRPLLVSFCISFIMLFTDAFNSTYSSAPFGFLPFFVGGFLFGELSKTQRSDFQAWCDSALMKVAFWAVPCSIIAATTYNLHVRDHLVSGVACLYGGSVLRSIRNGGLVDQQRTAEVSWEQMVKPKPPMLDPASTFCQSPTGVIDVAVVYIGAFVAISLAMSVIPREPVPILTKAGVNSIYIYFGHPGFAMVPAMAGAVGLLYLGVVLDPWLTVVTVLALVLFFLACLSQQWLRCFCKPFVEPDVEICCIRRKGEPDTDLKVV